jgi:predicted hotdog family 3-hydroxylacyl-ACP dehydratase
MSPSPSIESLLPQRGAMRLLSGLSRADAGGATAEAVVSERWPGGAEGVAEPALTVELIAQAAAAWLAAQRAPAPPAPGMLVGLSRATFEAAPLRPGDRLRVEVQEVWSRAGLRQIRGRVHHGAVEIATAELQVAVGEAVGEAVGAALGGGAATSKPGDDTASRSAGEVAGPKSGAAKGETGPGDPAMNERE